MNPWGLALAVFLGTLPMLAIAIWTKVELKQTRKELGLIRVTMRHGHHSPGGAF